MYPQIVRERLPRVQEAIARAAERSGRDPGSVKVVAVTKGHPPEAIRAVLDAGLVDVGENRVEELERKVPLFTDRGVQWHMIGHLQRRKAGRAVELADLIHSVDSIRLAEKLSRIGETVGRPVPVLIQVNASGEASKGGFSADEALEGLESVAELKGLAPSGLMTMAPFTGNDMEIRSTFRTLRTIREAASGIAGSDTWTLSMGMSNDFSIAIEEGSTMVRLGTALLGERRQ